MRVVVNQLSALGARTGIGHYTVQLLRCLRKQAGPDVIEAFPEGWLRGVREAFVQLRPSLEGQVQANGAGIPPIKLATRNWRSRALSQFRRLGRRVTAHGFRVLCQRRRYDLYHEPNFIPLPCDRPTIATLHDLSVLLHPEWHPGDRVAHFEKYFQRGLRRCLHFLAISEFARQEIICRLGIEPERVTRTYMGIRPGLAPLPRDHVRTTLAALGLPQQYLLCLGTIEPRKNVLLLLKAYASLPVSLRESWPLLLVGSWGWNAGPVANYLHGPGKHRGILHLGYLEEKHLAAVYNGARALLYPSLYEGFGLPPLEMMACGGAVICSTAGPLVETVGARAHLVHAEDADGWRRALLQLLTDEDWFQDLRKGVTEIARPYTWERCAAETLCTYRKVTCKGFTFPVPNHLSFRSAG